MRTFLLLLSVASVPACGGDNEDGKKDGEGSAANFGEFIHQAPGGAHGFQLTGDSLSLVHFTTNHGLGQIGIESGTAAEISADPIKGYDAEQVGDLVSFTAGPDIKTSTKFYSYTAGAAELIAEAAEGKEFINYGKANAANDILIYGYSRLGQEKFIWNRTTKTSYQIGASLGATTKATDAFFDEAAKTVYFSGFNQGFFVGKSSFAKDDATVVFKSTDKVGAVAVFDGRLIYVGEPQSGPQSSVVWSRALDGTGEPVQLTPSPTDEVNLDATTATLDGQGRVVYAMLKLDAAASTKRVIFYSTPLTKQEPLDLSSTRLLPMTDNGKAQVDAKLGRLSYMFPTEGKVHGFRSVNTVSGEAYEETELDVKKFDHVDGSNLVVLTGTDGNTKVMNLETGESKDVAVSLAAGESLGGPLFLGKDRLIFGRSTKETDNDSEGDMSGTISELILVDATGAATTLAEDLPATTGGVFVKLTPNGKWAVLGAKLEADATASYYRLRLP